MPDCLEPPADCAPPSVLPPLPPPFRSLTARQQANYAFAWQALYTAQAAYLKSLNSNEYRVLSRQVRHQRLTDLLAQVDHWQREVDAYVDGHSPIKTFYAISTYGG